MNVIEVENISKKFRLGNSTGDLREKVGALFSRRKHDEERAASDFWALQDISFTVEEGESFGIIGHNGSGKSTLLKLITGIYKPTTGTFKTRGRISALIEVGAGFHPDLTGRENVYLNGSVLGMKKREIDKRFDEIVAFSELEKFIDTPVKRYSSGMYMRLGFAVAAHVDPDIVLVDEVLAVGDESFQKKCMDKMHELRREGKTIVFISHGMDAIAALCQKVMLLSHGHALELGKPSDVISTYRTSLAMEREGRRRRDAPETLDLGKARRKPVEILDVRLFDSAGVEAKAFPMNGTLSVECHYHAHERIENPAFGVAINRTDDLYISGVNTKFDGLQLPPLEGFGKFTLTYSPLPLLQGVYRIDVAAFHADDTHTALSTSPDDILFSVTSDTLNHGAVDIPRAWQFDHEATSNPVRPLIDSGNPIEVPAALAFPRSLGSSVTHA